MGKDKHGKFIPPKGKPSGNGKEGLGLRRSLEPDQLEQDMEMTDKYTVGPDELTPGVHVRHPNRNTAKRAAQNNTDSNVVNSGVNNEMPSSDDDENIVSSAQPGEINARIDKDIFKVLSTFCAGCCVSVYLPTHAAGVEVNKQQDMIAFKHKLQRVEKKLLDKKHNQAEVTKMLQPAYDMLKNEEFWRNQQQGLALFISTGFFCYMRLPITVQEEIYLNNTFLATPLLPLITADEQFYLLALSQHKAKLYLADAFGMNEVPVPDMPNGIDDVVHFEEKGDEQLTRMGSGSERNTPHGMNSNPDHKKDVAIYLEEVERSLKPVLAGKNIPLMLAAVEYLIPIFRKHSHYTNIVEETLTGSFDRESPSSLHQMAKEKMEPFFNERRKTALKKYYDQSGGSLSASIPDDVIPAAYYGQVSSLFVQKGAHIWGSFDTDNSKVTIHDEEQAEDECLLNNAIVQTILHNGDVFLLDKEKMPAESPVAASLRYA
jgi:hypothetical protein